MTDSESVDEFAQAMITRIEPGLEPVLTKYVFIAEGMDSEGNRAIYSASTDNIALNDEMGLLRWGQSMCDAKVVVDRLRNDGLL